MVGRLTLTAVALAGVALAASASAVARQRPLYTRTATRSCLLRLPNSVAGLPPAQPPVPPTLFVDALTRDDLSTGGALRWPIAAHKQLAAWYGGRTYEGIILSFFKTAPGARASLKSPTSFYGSKLIRNVVATWDRTFAPSRRVRDTVFGCLRSEAPSDPAPRPPHRARLATFTGRWGGHTRGLEIAATGRSSEFSYSGCCVRDYRLTFRILSVRGTLTRAEAVYRVTSFKRYDKSMRRLHVGEVGKLLLRNGVVTNTLTRDFFCSDPAWGATGVCGA